MPQPLPNRPRLAIGTEVVPGPGDSIQIRGPVPPVRLTGGLARALVSLLDGEKSLDELCAALAGWPRESVLGAVRALAERGLLAEGPARPPATAADAAAQAQAAFYWSLSGGPAEAGEQALAALRRARIHLYGWGPVQERLAETLRAAGAAGLQVETWCPEATPPVPLGCPAPTDLAILALPRPAPALTAALHAICLAAQVPFLPAILQGEEAAVGPAVLPGRSPCYRCFQERLRSNQSFPEDEAAYATHLDQASLPPVLPEWPPFTHMVAAWTAMEAIRLVTGFVPPVTLGQVCFFQAGTGRQRLARLWKLPRCPECSPLSRDNGGYEGHGGHGSPAGRASGAAGTTGAARGGEEPHEPEH